MKTLKLTTALLILCVVTAFAAPRDHIDPKDLKDMVSLTLGTEGTIEFKQQGDVLTGPILNKQTDEEKPGLGVEFKKEDQLLMLTVQNRYSKALRYRAAMRLKGGKEYIETSIIPVMAGLMSFESWQDPIEELILFDFKLTDEKL